MSEKEIYIDINELAQLKGLTNRAIRLSISRGRYVAREIEVHGGKSYEVLLSSIENHMQEMYLKQSTEKTVEEIENYSLISQNNQNYVPQSAKDVALY